MLRGTLLVGFILLSASTASALDFDKEIAKQERTSVRLVESAKGHRNKVFARKSRSQKGFTVALIQRR